MAEIFMQHVPFSTNHVRLSRQIAAIIHGPEFAQFSTGLPTNFNVFLFRDRRGGSGHTGKGALTLPSASIAQHFLLLYGNRRRGTILYSISNRAPRTDVVELITQTPYQDPEALEKKEQRQEKLKGNISLQDVQLGWRTRDDEFSVEWSASDDETINPKGPFRLTFNEESRDIRIQMDDVANQQPGRDLTIESILLDFSFRSVTKYYISSKFSRVESVAIERVPRKPPAILLTFITPPAFEVIHEHPEHLLIFSSSNSQGPKLQRLSHFGQHHARVVPYTSLAIRLQCLSDDEIDQFTRMAREVMLPEPLTIYQAPVFRSLFTSDIMEPLQGWMARLDWLMAFQCQALLSNLLLDPRELWKLRSTIEGLTNLKGGVLRASEVLRLFAARLKTMSWEGNDESGASTVSESLKRANEDVTPLHMHMRDQSGNEAFFNCLHVTCTPTRMILDGPFPDQSNRVIRRYPKHHHCFVRVNFTDEEQLDFRWDREVDGQEFVRRRVGGTLKDGIDIAGRHLDFLAYSSSALKDHAVWFCMPFVDEEGKRVTSASILASLGTFTKVIKCPARYGARISQAFTATEPSITLETEEVIPIKDITVVGPGPLFLQSTFTDGIGTMSRELANNIASAMQKRPGNKKMFWIKPSAYQVRIGGYKGMLAVDYTLGKEPIICVRPSMDKFDAPHSLDIEIASAFYKPGPMYLNRYLIMILETLGVPIQVFVDLLEEAIDDVHAASESIESCAHFLEQNGIGTAFRLPSVFLSLHKIRMDFRDQGALRVIDDPFLDRAIGFATNHVLRELKHRARIPLKGSYTLVGVVDEHGWLEPDEIFVCIRHKDQKAFYLEGTMLVTRSPQVHPGDVQFATAIGSPPPGSPFEHEEFPNCVVFSSQGTRSLPSQLSGGDLDGDLYNIITDTELFPTRVMTPGAYDAVPMKLLDRDCTINDLADWVADYINTDILGLVSHQFLILADQSDDMAANPGCIKLAELASAAVDFAKSGTPVNRDDMPPLRFKAKPDWCAGEMSFEGGRFYESKRAIGELYRRIDLNPASREANQAARQVKNGLRKKKKRRNEPRDSLTEAMQRLTFNGPDIDTTDPISSALRPLLRNYIDVDDVIPEEYTNVAIQQFKAYRSELRHICASASLTHIPLSEEEVLMGTIAGRTSQPKRRRDLMAQMRDHSSELVKKIRLELSGHGKDDDIRSLGRGGRRGEEDLEDWLLKSWAAWQISLMEEDSFAMKSFGWVALGAIFEAVRAIEDRNREERWY